jgi:hypothetical protein
MLHKPKASEKQDRKALRKIVGDLLQPSAVLSDIDTSDLTSPNMWDETVKDFLDKLPGQNVGTLLEPRVLLDHFSYEDES